MENKRLDVLGLGCTAVDDILYVAEYPAADAKVEVRARERHCGGLTATALVAAARLGGRCAFAGTLGDDGESRFVLDALAAEKIDVRQVIQRPGAGPIRSIIVVDESRRSRNIFYNASQAFGADPHRPSVEVIQSTRVLLVDRFGIPGMIRAARIARRAGIAVVADFETFQLPRFDELLALCDHLIVSESFARRFTGARTPRAGVARLWGKNRQAVVVTCGADGCWYRDESNSKPRHCPAFPVQALDTTGCGDVFHGAYALALARGLPIEERLRFASAAAGIKATQHGGQSGIPNARKVREFLRQRAPS